MNTAHKLAAPGWLLVLLMGLPVVGETIYSPSLPMLALDLQTSSTLVELTLTLYLAGFALGVAGWGIVADRYGRRPAMLGGLFIYLLCSVGCLFVTSITQLLVLRLLQAAGGSAGSVVGQTMLRDQFEGNARNRIFAQLSMAMSAAPAIGTFIGGILTGAYGWMGTFWFLAITGVLMWFYCVGRLGETRSNQNTPRGLAELMALLPRMLRDGHILRSAALVAFCNGIFFSFYAEGPFLLIEHIGLHESAYGVVGLSFALTGIAAAYASKRLVGRYRPEQLSYCGSVICCAGAILLLALAAMGAFEGPYGTLAVLLPMSTVTCGIGIIIPNTLSIALRDYSSVLGTAGSLLGFVYYSGTALISASMSLLHNGTVFPFPLLLVTICAAMLLCTRMALPDQETTEAAAVS